MKHLLYSLPRNKIAWALAGLVALRVVFLLLAISGVPDIGVTSEAQTWWWTYGGDAGSYAESARSLLGETERLELNLIGFPLLLAAFMWLFDARSLAEVGNLYTAFNGVVVYGAAILLFYFIGKELLGSRTKALALAGFFTVHPYLFYAFFEAFGNGSKIIEDFAISRFQRLMFFTAESDGLALVATLASFLIVLYVLRGKLSLKSPHLVLLGALTSLAIITRLQVAVLVPLYTFFLAARHKLTELALFLLGALPLLLLQLWYNFASAGNVLGSVYGDKVTPEGLVPLFALWYPVRLVTYPLEYSPLLFIPMALGLGLLFRGFGELGRRFDRQSLLFVGGYLLLTTVPLFFIEPSFRNPRYFLPALPILLSLMYLGTEAALRHLWPRKLPK